MDGQAPPHDIAAEQAVLGSMMQSADALAEGLERLTSASFYRPAHQTIFDALRALCDGATPVDTITVKDTLDRSGVLGRVGGAPYLHTLVASPPAPSSCGYYAAIVEDLALQRRIIMAGAQIGRVGWAQDLDRTERMNAMHQAFDAVTDGASSAGAVSAAELIDPAIEAIEAATEGEQRGLETPWSDINRLLGGLRPGQLVTVAGRPGMGKSIVLLNLATHAGIRLRTPVLVSTLEMSRQECMERVIAETAGVDLSRLRSGDLGDFEWDRVAKARTEISSATTLMINDDPHAGVEGIRADLRAMRRAGYPAGLVVVDYLGLMEARGRVENRQTEVSGFSRSLKIIAKEFGVPVVMGAQINRGPEMRADKKPLLADLRESGAIEQDSDVVILLYRDDAYEKESPRSGEIDLIVAKNRQGPQSTVTLAFRGRFASCDDMYREPDPTSSGYVDPSQPRSVED